jgi:hypothetical protein
MLRKEAIVSIQKHDVRSLRFLYPSITGDRDEALITLMDVTHISISTYDLAGLIRGAVVHHKNLASGHGLRQGTIYRFADKWRLIITGDDDAGGFHSARPTPRC